MILLVTNKRDITIDFIVLELRKREIPYFRFNTEDVGGMTFVLPDGDAAQTQFSDGKQTIHLQNVRSAYYRRPMPPQVASSAELSVREYIADEWTALMRSIWTALESRWLNSPNAIQLAEDKPRQLALARTIGFRVPKVTITNCFNAALDFASASRTIGKPLRHALLEDESGPGRVIFTSRINICEDDHAAIARAPVIFQREIAKRSDIRVTVVDQKVMATSISSQCHAETEVDWRRGARVDLDHHSVDLPSEIAAMCVEITSLLGLRYSAIDLIEDEEGDFWFLEANPNGQWAWIEQRTGQPITSTIVDALAK